MQDEKNVVSLESSPEELEQQLLKETDIEELKNVINLFNLNIKKKDIIRTNKLSNLQDLVTDQMQERIERNAGAFSNKDLIDYFKTIQESIKKADNSLSNIDTPAIQLNQQFNLNVENKDVLDKDSRDKVADAVKSILDKMKAAETSTEIVEVDNYEVEESDSVEENN